VKTPFSFCMNDPWRSSWTRSMTEEETSTVFSSLLFLPDSLSLSLPLSPSLSFCPAASSVPYSTTTHYPPFLPPPSTLSTCSLWCGDKKCAGCMQHDHAQHVVFMRTACNRIAVKLSDGKTGKTGCIPKTIGAGRDKRIEDRSLW
jgi:hypothetical protein